MNPPRLPIELMNAMPAAAALPLRKLVGSDQKGPRVLQIPMAASVKAATPATALVPSTTRDAAPNPAAPTRQARPTARFRSAERSERIPAATIAAAAQP